MSKSMLHLDLHELARDGKKIDAALNAVVARAVERRVKSVEIIPGKGSGQLKKRVLKFFDRKDIKVLYKRVEVDDKNHGRIFVHFR